MSHSSTGKKSIKLVRYDVSEQSEDEGEVTGNNNTTPSTDTANMRSHKLASPALGLSPAEKFNAFKKTRVEKKMEGELSQAVVDDFFKDFLATKMKQINDDYKEKEDKKETEVACSVEEMSKLLDAEITQLTIPSKTNTKPSEAFDVSTATAAFDPAEVGFKPVVASNETKPVVKVKTEPKKLGFKNFGIKLSLTSAELIQSGEIHKKGKRLEEGEVLSSQSEGSRTESDDEDSDQDVSGTGSLTGSDKDNKSSKAKKKKKKKKHKHKKKKKHKEKDKDKDRGDSKEKSSKRKHSHKSRSRSRSPKKSKKSRSSRSRSRERSRRKSRSRSLSPDHFWRSKYGDFDAYLYQERSGRESSRRGPDRSRSRSTSRDRDKHRSRYHDRDRERDRDRDKYRDRDKDRERGEQEKPDKHMEDLRVKIDKAKLREIAIKNAIANARTGTGPLLDVTTKAGGKSVEELTDFCKRISSKDKMKGKYDLSSSSSEEEPDKKSDDDDDENLIHHPFKVKDASIVMDIRNAKQLPTVSPSERLAQASTLRIQFPVSSGSQHRMKEWVPVEKSEPTSKASAPAATPKPSSTSGFTVPALPAPAAPAAPAGVAPVKPEDKVFEDPPVQPLDIASIISERIHAVRKLQENPLDVSAQSVLSNAQKQVSLWAQSKQLPGQFLGSTGASVLSQQELMGPNKRKQAWAKKEQLVSAAPIRGGIGMFLLEKMGWKQGTGLGKNNEGSVEPLMLDVKVDRKGLSSQGEGVKKGGAGGAAPVVRMPAVKDLSGKHPVSALVELCNKRKWLPPQFDIIHESGPDHKKNFLFKVRVNGTEYQPSVASNNKKNAKAQAATVCLQTLGLVPR